MVVADSALYRKKQRIKMVLMGLMPMPAESTPWAGIGC